jgi:hypothetical protein
MQVMSVSLQSSALANDPAFGGELQAQAQDLQGLAERYRAQVERSAFNTLALLVRPLGYSNLEVRFAPKQELSTDVGMASLTQSDPAVAMPAPAGDALFTARGRSASS